MHFTSIKSMFIVFVNQTIGLPVTAVRGPTLNFQKSHELVMKNHKIEQKFPSIVKILPVSSLVQKRFKKLLVTMIGLRVHAL